MTTLPDTTSGATTGGGPDVRTTEVDGVPVLWAEAPGPLRAHLLLRAGTADETLPTRGWTHLVEHLALSAVGRPGEHSNGYTSTTTTGFHVEGRPEQVVEFLGRVSADLADVPLGRLEPEVGVLRAEEGRRGGATSDTLLSWRYGARDYGLAGTLELGLSVAPGRDALHHFARTRSARAGAVLWLSGPPPAGLRLHLPEGERLAPPDPWRNAAGDLPAWFTGGDHAAAALAVVRRGWQVPALRHVLHARLVDELRVDLAVAYSPSVDYAPVTGDTGWLSLHTDLVGGRQSEGVGPFLRLLAALGDEDGPQRVTEADLEPYRAAVGRRGEDPYAWASALQSAAWDTLFHRDDVGRDGDPAAVTAEQVRAAARDASTQLLAAVPRGLGTYRGRWSEAVASRTEPVSGTVHRALGADGSVVRSVEGVTLEGAGRWTVRADAAAAVLAWPDGRRTLVADDGVQVVVEPTLYEDGAGLVRHVDSLFAPHLRVPMPARAAGSVPAPSSTVPGPPAGGAGPVTARLDGLARRHRWLALTAMLAGVVALAVLLGMLLWAAGLPVAVTGPATVGLGVAAVRRWQVMYPPPRARQR